MIGRIIIRGWPGHHWIIVSAGRVGPSGHHELYRGIVLRHTLSLHDWGVSITRLPRFPGRPA